MTMLREMLQREWLDNAAVWHKAADDWRKDRDASDAERHHNIREYTKWAKESEARAAKAPVKIVHIFADGTQRVFE